MSGLDWMKAERRRLARGVRFRPEDVYASVPTTWMRGAVRSLSPAAFRVFWLANAGWAPSHRPGERGRTVLAYSMIRHPSSQSCQQDNAVPAGRSAIAAGICEAIRAGFVELAQAGSRPRGQAGARGRAAEYFLPCLEAGAAVPIAVAQLPRLSGKVRLHAALMRSLAARLSGSALRLLGLLISCGHREASGALVDAGPMVCSVSELAHHLQMSRSSVADALHELQATKQLTLVVPGSGRRPASCRLNARFVEFTKSARCHRPVQNDINCPSDLPPTPHGRVHGVPIADTTRA
ncbi:hypothetical protein [Neoroseomonas soli]|uniref:Uncharacterized protein n=1 Tax=Neoroseomonas soli TaxID=1081025 RepID=A0A9X9X356_9PROT|nr:hypothetical protein [Neoroseomonas soli]MBR0673835.1 hypothetical protein [Neoroseomonas soli]